MIFQTCKVLVCDDQPMLRMLLSSAICEHTPYAEVFEAENGHEAQKLLAKHDFNAIFLDVEMPVQDGFTTLRNIREQNLAADASVVMCTGCSEESDLIQGWQLRADYYLTKPFDLEEIDQVLDDVLRRESAVA